MALFLVTSVAGAVEIPSDVKDHAPIYISRRDQIRHSQTDRVLGMGYSVSENGTSRTIRYTTFFSDEDSIRSIEKTDRQMALYGRRLDVEWTYEVTLNSQTGKASERHYQCDSFLGIGHKRCAFRGKFAAGTSRPILYINARHNIFGDRPEFPYGSRRGRVTRIDPSFEIPFPKSRDMIPIEHPNLLRSSDQELTREGKLSSPSTDYVYLRVRGNLSGRFRFSINASNGEIFRSGSSKKDALEEMGLDLWGAESVVAIAVPKRFKTDLRLGHRRFYLDSIDARESDDPPSRLVLADVGVYLVEKGSGGKYRTVDLSDRVRCSVLQSISGCIIN